VTGFAGASEQASGSERRYSRDDCGRKARGAGSEILAKLDGLPEKEP
jgi:hypothetical protein